MEVSSWENDLKGWMLQLGILHGDCMDFMR